MLRLSPDEGASVRAALDDAAQFMEQAIKRLDEACEILVARASSGVAGEGQVIRELRRRIDQGRFSVERRSEQLAVAQDHDPSALKF